MRSYFELPGSRREDVSSKLLELNYIAVLFGEYKWGADVDRGLLWFDGPPGDTADYKAATKRWQDDIARVGLGNFKLRPVDAPH